jgi:uncharacterized repeat protein (TIGR01451 family)
MKVYRMIWTRRPAWALLASASALLLAAALALLVFRLQVLAQPTPETMDAVLSVEKSVNTDLAAPGSTLAYTITIQNTGDSPANVWMTDTLPTDLVYVADSLTAPFGSYGIKNNVITWTRDLYIYQTVVINFSAQIPQDATAPEIENTAQVTGTGVLITDSAVTTVMSPLDNEGTYKAVGQGLVEPGDLLTYTIVLNNASTFNDVTAQVIDPLHPLLEYVDGSHQTAPPNGGTLVVSQGITWTVDVTRSTTVTLTFQARVSDSATDGTVITNTATIDDGSTPLERNATITVNQPPTSLTTSPEKWALFTKASPATVLIEGVAWDSTMWDENNGPDFPPDPVLDPIENSDGDGRYYVSWAKVPSALSYVLQESKSAYFSDYTEYHQNDFQEYLDKFYIDIYGKSPGIYYYRVLASNMAGGDGRWSDVESVVVRTTQAFDLSAMPDAPPVPLSSPSAELATSDAITVEVRVGDTAPWEVVTLASADWGGWEWSYRWDLPAPVYDKYVIQTRARDSAGNIGAIDTITVAVHNKDFLMHLPLVFKRWPPIPYKTIINPIDNADEDGDYTVTWLYSHTNIPAESFTLQESKDDATFANPTTYSTDSKSYAFTNKDDGIYWYRVRAVNQYGQGAWSDKVSTKVERSYHDDFSAATTWAFRRGDDIIKESNNFRIRYRDGNMYVLVVGSYDFGVVSPMVEAPAVPYTIQGRVRVVKNESFDGRNYYIRNGTTFGLVFGGNGGSPCPADRKTEDNKGCLEHYYRLMAIYDVHSPDKFSWQLKRIDYHDSSDDGKGKGPKLIYGYTPDLERDEWNTWKIVVTDLGITIYVNGEYLSKTTDTTYINDPYFGIFIGSPDIGDTAIKWDWYEVRR